MAEHTFTFFTPPKPCSARVAPMKGRIKTCGMAAHRSIDGDPLCSKHYRIRADKIDAAHELAAREEA
jgi:hypothetical protein